MQIAMQAAWGVGYGFQELQYSLLVILGYHILFVIEAGDSLLKGLKARGVGLLGMQLLSHMCKFERYLL